MAPAKAPLAILQAAQQTKATSDLVVRIVTILRVYPPLTPPTHSIISGDAAVSSGRESYDNDEGFKGRPKAKILKPFKKRRKSESGRGRRKNKPPLASGDCVRNTMLTSELDTYLGKVLKLILYLP